LRQQKRRSASHWTQAPVSIEGRPSSSVLRLMTLLSGGSSLKLNNVTDVKVPLTLGRFFREMYERDLNEKHAFWEMETRKTCRNSGNRHRLVRRKLRHKRKCRELIIADADEQTVLATGIWCCWHHYKHNHKHKHKHKHNDNIALAPFLKSFASLPSKSAIPTKSNVIDGDGPRSGNQQPRARQTKLSLRESRESKSRKVFAHDGLRSCSPEKTRCEIAIDRHVPGGASMNIDLISRVSTTAGCLGCARKKRFEWLEQLRLEEVDRYYEQECDNHFARQYKVLENNCTRRKIQKRRNTYASMSCA